MKKLFVIVAIILMLLLIGYYFFHKNLLTAPGCIKTNKLIFGGCFGKTLIFDLNVNPRVECLSIDINNCNGGILVISNLCNESFVTGNIEIKPQDKYVGLDVLKDEINKYSLIYSDGNFARYIPKQNEKINIIGVLGNQTIEISFIKTKELC